MGIAFLALGSCILFSLKKGWGSKTVLGFFFFWFVFWEICVLKQHEMLPVFLFLFFLVAYGFLTGCFWKVPLGLGFYTESFCLIKGLSPKRSVLGIALLGNSTKCCPFFSLVFFQVDFVFLIGFFEKFFLA